MSVFVFRGNQQAIDWLGGKLSSYLDLGDLIENPGGVPEVVLFDVHPELKGVELRQVPHDAEPISIERCPCVTWYGLTGDEDADFDNILDLLREAKRHAGSVRPDPPPG